MAKRHNRITVPDAEPGSGSERLCAVTRVHLPPDDLVRFVLAPDGGIVPDLDRKLPGRGVWVTAQRAIVDQAVAKKAFAKSLKAEAKAPSNLGAMVDDLLARRVAGALSLANKAGLAVTGFEKVFATLEKGPVAVIVHGTDAAADGRSKIDRKYQAIQRSQDRAATIVDVLTSEQLSLAIGRGSVVHAALIPGGLSDRFREEAVRLKRYRASATESVKDLPELIAEG
jgi:uncharacterized protein